MGIPSSIYSMKTVLSGAISGKAKFNIEGELLPLYVQFNPEQYSIREAVKYRHLSAQGSDLEILQYEGKIMTEVKLSFYFDTDSVLATSVTKSSVSKDVTTLTNKFSALLQLRGELHRPPLVNFVWGSINLTGVISSVSTSFTMFDKKGVPVRAKVDCTLLSEGNESALRRSPLESPDRTKSRVLSEDVNLWALAANEYGDPGKWRIIAKANNILDPLDIPVGTVLKVPALTDL